MHSTAAPWLESLSQAGVQHDLKCTSFAGGSPFLPRGAVVRLNAHNQEDGVPAGPADKGAPDYKGVKPLACMPQQDSIGEHPCTHINQLQRSRSRLVSEIDNTHQPV